MKLVRQVFWIFWLVQSTFVPYPFAPSSACEADARVLTLSPDCQAGGSRDIEIHHFCLKLFAENAQLQATAPPP
ncbi:hypothetical protein EV356DRAFT_506755 [Viridothelium virens]|uniref:Secreted protein n=1 Tax=Viridothelium virens TaxID=1048519 RepID=A0A6A6H1G7_VIRVR|nr:hypothetical protein EV356DRAFT_506755 [Viridothelium virens]